MSTRGFGNPVTYNLRQQFDGRNLNSNDQPIGVNFSQQTTQEVNQINPANEEHNFRHFMDSVLRTGLGINDEQYIHIVDEMVRNYNDSERYSMINNRLLNQLVANDIEIRNLERNGPLAQYFQEDGALHDQWKTFKNSLAKLQGLVILKRIVPGNCQPVVETLIKAFSDKINTVNAILEDNLANPPLAGGSLQNSKDSKNYKNKYWKYRFKYELLKKERE